MSDASAGPVVSRPRLAASMARRRQNILDAAVGLFKESGYLGTTVDDIADRAGVTKRTLYHHMGTKEKILVEIHTNFIDIGLERWEAVLEEGGSPTHVLERLLEEHVRMVGEHRDAIAVFLEESKHLNPVDRDAIAVRRDEYESILRSVVADGIAKHDFRSDIDHVFATRLILGGLTEMYRWYRPKNAAAKAAAVKVCTRLALDGLQPSRT